VGELGVHLATCGVMALLGLRQTRPLFLIALGLAVALVASQSRGGMLAFLGPVLLALPFARHLGRILLVGLGGLMLLGAAYAVDLRAPVAPAASGGDRAFGARQIVDNVVSVVLPDAAESRQLGDTSRWRMMWWQHIVHYTFEGEYFWTGKGFGMNLAVADGFSGVERGEPPLRSPHNSHMNVLARLGVPGILLWVGFLGAWFVHVLGCALRARQRGDGDWARLLGLTACCVVAQLINTSFDVALEGPMLAVWFWSTIGFGLAVPMVYAARSRSLDSAALARSMARPVHA
jgi:hypothetical protein